MQMWYTVRKSGLLYAFMYEMITVMTKQKMFLYNVKKKKKDTNNSVT